MDQSTLSLREQAMGGAGFATAENAGALYTNPAQLVNMKGSEIRSTLEMKSSTEFITGGFPIITDSAEYQMIRQSSLFSIEPKPHRHGRLAFGISFGRLYTDTELYAYRYDMHSDALQQSGEAYLDGSFDWRITSGYGISLPGSSDKYHSSLGLSADITFKYRPNFGDEKKGVEPELRLGYLGTLLLGNGTELCIGVTAGGAADPIIDAKNRFEYSTSVGIKKVLISNVSVAILGIIGEAGITHTVYPSESYKGFPNPQFGCELNLWERFAVRTGARRIKSEGNGWGSVAREMNENGESVLSPYMDSVVTVDDLEFSYGFGVTPFPIFSLDFTGRTFLRSDYRKGQNQFALDMRFHWNRK